jgi:hypothetical protein
MIKYQYLSEEKKMTNKKKKPFTTLAVRSSGGGEISSVFTTKYHLGEALDPFDHTIAWSEFAVYGIPDSEIDEEEGWDEDYSKATLIYWRAKTMAVIKRQYLSFFHRLL